MPYDRALLNGPQRLHLAVLAAGIEDAITEIARLTDPPTRSSSTLTHLDDDLPPGFAEHVAPILDRLRASLTQFADDFELEARSYSRARSVGAYVTSAVARIDESGVDQLRGYGVVAPGLGTVLDPMLRDLRARLAAIGTVLHDSGDLVQDLTNPWR
jgi:hypothetical protein